MKIVSRKEAQAAGLKTYFTGKPCPAGHIAPKTTSSNGCHECVKARGKLHYQKNKQAYIERAKASYWADPDKYKARQKERRVVYGDEFRARDRAYGNANAAARAERAKAWRENNPDRWALIHVAVIQRRRARLAAAGGSFSADDVVRMLEVQRYACNYCEAHLDKYHVDHIRPIAKGGDNSPSNLQVLCPSCNTKKGAKWPYHYEKDGAA